MKSTAIQAGDSTVKTTTSGSRCWYDNQKKYHRLDGPAFEGSDGSKFWYVHGTCHRADGPAVELSNGSKTWWIHDNLIVRLVPKKNKGQEP